MQSMWMSVLGLGGAVVVAGCGGAGSEPSAGPEVTDVARSASTTASGTGASAFAFFVATQADQGYRVSAVNDAPFACGKHHSATWCFVSSIDLSQLDLPAGVVTTLLGQVGTDPYAPTILFAGAISAGTLSVQEVWRAPAALPLSGPLLHVSHTPERALVANSWSSTTIGPIDFSSAPMAEQCQATDAGTQCRASLAPVELDVTLPAGALLAGWSRRGGTFHVEQYFLEVTVGMDQTPDGYSYCQAGQELCPDFLCTVSGCITGIHGGGGLNPAAMYVRSGAASYDAWLVATGQLLPTDTH